MRTLLPPSPWRGWRVRRAALACLSRLESDGRIAGPKKRLMGQMLQALAPAMQAADGVGAYRAAARQFAELGRKSQGLPIRHVTAHDWIAASHVATYLASEREWS